LKEFAFYAQMRSGHHAVINWLRFQINGGHAFLNACKPGESPLESHSLKQSRIGWGERDIRARKMLLYPALKLGLFNAVLYNYEEFLPPQDPKGWFNSKAEPTVIIVLRSPANLLASRMKWELTFLSQFDRITDEILAQRLNETIETWIEFAKLYLSSDFRSIYYDRWFVDQDYKRQIMESLGIGYMEPERNEITEWGPGSSFNFETEVSGKQLDVLNRWKIYQDDPRFVTPIRIEKVKELVREIDPDSESTRWITSL